MKRSGGGAERSHRDASGCVLCDLRMVLSRLSLLDGYIDEPHPEGSFCLHEYAPKTLPFVNKFEVIVAG